MSITAVREPVLEKSKSCSILKDFESVRGVEGWGGGLKTRLSWRGILEQEAVGQLGRGRAIS